jgi:hypothetical protein
MVTVQASFFGLRSNCAEARLTISSSESGAACAAGAAGGQGNGSGAQRRMDHRISKSGRVIANPLARRNRNGLMPPLLFVHERRTESRNVLE